MEFGACAWYLKSTSVGKNKADLRWEERVWLGTRDRSGEVLVGTSEGIIKVRTVRRNGNEGAKWNEEAMSAMKGTPWEPVPGREGIYIKFRSDAARSDKDGAGGKGFCM